MESSVFIAPDNLSSSVIVSDSPNASDISASLSDVVSIIALICSTTSLANKPVWSKSFLYSALLVRTDSSSLPALARDSSSDFALEKDSLLNIFSNASV